MRFVFMGPPGAGKGTQAKAVAGHYGVPHVSSGDIFRAEIGNKTPLGLKIKSFLETGALVPDEITVAAVAGRLAAKDCAQGWLLDGFPRTDGQARALDAALAKDAKKLSAVVNLEVNPETIVERMSGRRTCPNSKCGRSYHVLYIKPKADGKCDACDADLVTRKDDEPETVRQRLDTYNKQTTPLIEYYKRQGLLVRVDGSGTPDQVRARLFEQLKAVVGR
ncbi:MAG: adenylate kinase [Planctomycetota bacterium]|nr:adenylate kinase [Planctomycetota bacterium]